MKINIRIVLLIFGILIFIPSLIFILLDQPSYASGMIVSCVIIIIIYQCIKHHLPISTIANNRILFKYFSVGLLLIIIHGSIAFFITYDFSINRFLGSILIIILILVTIGCVINILFNTSEKSFEIILKTISLFFAIITVSSGMLRFAPLSQYYLLNRHVFPFLEPSHYALIIAPYFLWILAIQKETYMKIIILLFISTLLLFISNLTLVCLIGLGAFLSFGYKKFALFIVIMGLIIYLGGFDLIYYTKRADINDANLSTLVWIQGWEESWINFVRTYGIGVGFQQFGVAEPKGDAAQSLYVMFNNEYLNRYDGGTFGSKLIGEFGFLGIACISWILLQIYKSFKYLRKVYEIPYSPRIIFFHCCIAYFCIEIFVRSTSYIAPGFFIFMIGIIGVNIVKVNRKQNE